MVYNWILKESATMFTFDLETWLNVPAHPLPRGSVNVDKVPDSAKRESKYALIFFA